MTVVKTYIFCCIEINLMIEYKVLIFKIDRKKMTIMAYVNVKEFDPSSGKVVLEEEGIYYKERFLFKDVFNSRENKSEVKWKLMHYEKERIRDNDIQYRFDATVNSNGDYCEIDMSVKDLLFRRIYLDDNGNVLSDCIFDAFLNSMEYQVFVAYGDPYDYKKQEPGLNIKEYLKTRHVFVNRINHSDIYQNRWLLDDFFKYYLRRDENEFTKMELGYLDYPEQKIYKKD